jgi:hypothetical protein
MALIKINDDQISQKAKLVASGGIDALFLNPNTVISINAGTGRLLTVPTSIFPASGSSIVVAKPTEKGDEVVVVVERPDVPDISDIEIVKNEKYWDAAKKQERGRLVIKVINRSNKKEEVVGIDARIYNPAEKVIAND